LTLALLTAVACGSKGDSQQAPVDADTTEQICEPPDGHAYVFTKVEALPPPAGRDIDGDGTIDNEWGSMPSSVLGAINAAFEELVQTGELSDLVIITGWDGPPVATQEGVGLMLASAEDSDNPPDPTDNGSGHEEFYLQLAEFDLSCQPRTAAQEVTLQDRELSIYYDLLELPHQSATFGTMSLHDVVGTYNFNEDFSVLDGSWSGTVSLCTLSLIPFPGEISGTTLDFLLASGILGPIISVDIDIDGDGLEQAISDGVTLKECIDGDGTVIPGADCACHPSIRDGISTVLRIESVPARVIGFR
jgi:hypothetical protein